MKFILAFLLLSATNGYSQRITPLPECPFIVKVEKTYFHNKPDLNKEIYEKRKGYLVQGDKVWTVCKYSFDDFVYVEFKNSKGQISKGFILRKDLQELDIED